MTVPVAVYVVTHGKPGADVGEYCGGDMGDYTRPVVFLTLTEAGAEARRFMGASLNPRGWESSPREARHPHVERAWVCASTDHVVWLERLPVEGGS